MAPPPAQVPKLLCIFLQRIQGQRQHVTSFIQLLALVCSGNPSTDTSLTTVTTTPPDSSSSSSIDASQPVKSEIPAAVEVLDAAGVLGCAGAAPDRQRSKSSSRRVYACLSAISPAFHLLLKAAPIEALQLLVMTQDTQSWLLQKGLPSSLLRRG
jgi:hypothetical protein